MGERIRYTFHAEVVSLAEYREVVRTEIDDSQRPVNVTEHKGWKVIIPGGSSFVFMDKDKPDIKAGEIIEITIKGTRNG